MYRSIFYNKKSEEMAVWDDVNGFSLIPFKNFAFEEKENGKYKTLFGKSVDKVYNFQDYDPRLYESDFPIETKFLIEKYGESDEISKNHNIIIIDIETDSENGFPDMTKCDKEITAISIYDKTSNFYYCFILDKELKISENLNKENIIIYSFNNEENLLKSFLNKWEEIGPTIITGWNSCYNGENGGFDIPYIYGRIKNILGDKDVSRLSPVGICYPSKRDGTIRIAGVNCIDYMLLYKKFRYEPRPTHALGYIGKVEVNKGKVIYTGSLNKLYSEDINKYVEYNLCDVEIVKLIDEKFKFLELAMSICHTGHVPYEWYHMSSRWIEGAIINYMRKNGNYVAPNKPPRSSENDDDKFIGAYVKDPIPGLYDWVFSADINSLYPSIIRTINISVETYMGKVEGWDVDKYLKNELSELNWKNKIYSPKEFFNLLIENKLCMGSNGAVYESKQGIIPSILDNWFEKRNEYQSLVKQYDNEGNKEKSDYYNRLQHLQKIFLNSIYGILGLKSGRFYRLEDAEAVTVSGQFIIKTTEKIIIDTFKKKNKEIKNIDEIVIGADTDSNYVSAIPLIEFYNIPPEKCKEFTIELCDEIINKINNFYPILSKRMFNSNNNKIKILGESICKTMLWTSKKHYAYHEVFDLKKGKNTDKVKFKGLDVVRSSFPEKFRVFYDKFLKSILYKKSKEELDEMILDFKKNLKNSLPLEISRSTSVKFISDKGDRNYNPKGRGLFEIVDGTPGAVISALYYNDLLKKFNLSKKIESIFSGQKVRWIYLKSNEYRVDRLAMKADGTDPDEIMNIINKNLDYNKMYEAELETKLIEIYNIFHWEIPNESMKIAAQFFEF